jgi:uncharacterized protein (TIGR01777 family)
MSENQTDTNIKKNSSVLITGGSGLVGRYLTSALLSEGYKVSHLSRKANQFGKVRVFRWDPEKAILNPQVFEGIDYIVHLAGANIGEKRWTKRRKVEILDSRVDSAKLLFKIISENDIKLKAFISASAIGYYGSRTSDKIFTEEELPGKDFLGSTCKLWEEAADQFVNTGARIVKIRTAVVMEKSDSALSKLLKPARLGVFPRLGNGRQYMPWIHIADLCGIYLKAIQDDNMEGVYNAVSPQHITQSEFMKTLAQVMKKPFFHPPIPSFFLKMVLGEMADVVLKGSRVSSVKLKNARYNFLFSNLEDTLYDVIYN